MAGMSDGLKKFLRTVSRPVRRVRGRGGVVLLPYRGYGSRERAFLIGRVFYQRSATPVQGPWDVRRQLRDVFRRLVRRPMVGALVRGEVLGATAEATTDADGYFRLEWRFADVAWTRPALAPRRRCGSTATDAEATGEIYVPPERARFVVISDIDDTVMRTGVANKLGMTWRLFVRDAEEPHGLSRRRRALPRAPRRRLRRRRQPDALRLPRAVGHLRGPRGVLPAPRHPRRPGPVPARMGGEPGAARCRGAPRTTSG